MIIMNANYNLTAVFIETLPNDYTDETTITPTLKLTKNQHTEDTGFIIMATISITIFLGAALILLKKKIGTQH